jgi:hypothetical protein
MKRSTRYLFIGVGLLVFFILAPLIVLYISGTRFNPDSNRYEQTGILNAITKPDGATLSLDGTRRDDTPATVRFLNPGEYDVTLSKTGYHDWTKRLEVKPAKVAYATNGTDAVYLLKRDVLPHIIGENVKSFHITSSEIWYVSDNKLISAKIDNLSQTATVNLPLSPLVMVASANDRYLLLVDAASGAVWYDRESKQLLDATAAITPEGYALVTNDGLVINLQTSTGSLSIYNVRTKQQFGQAKNIGGITLLEDTLYYTQTTPQKTIIAVTDAGKPNFTTAQILYEGIPLQNPLFELSLYITPRKELFAFDNGTLYRVGENLDIIASGVTSINFEQNVPSLAFTTATEQWYYDFTGSHAKLYTRSTAGVSSPVVRSSIGYSFFFNSGKLQALELDTRDRQNSYALVEVKNPQRLYLDNAGKVAYFLDNETLRTIELR